MMIHPTIKLIFENWNIGGSHILSKFNHWYRLRYYAILIHEHEENSDLDNNVDEVVNIDQNEWKQVLVNITMQHMETKPDYIYKEFLCVMREERGMNDDDLSSKEKATGKISYTQTSLKKKLKQSIIS